MHGLRIWAVTRAATATTADRANSRAGGAQPKLQRFIDDDDAGADIRERWARWGVAIHREVERATAGGPNVGMPEAPWSFPGRP